LACPFLGTSKTNGIQQAVSLQRGLIDTSAGATARKARQRAGARHARKSTSADFLRVAPLPPRKKARGAFDPPCTP
jgi:hypothetical protein